MDLIDELEELVDMTKMTVIGGDMNICALAQPNNQVARSLRAMGFKQIVTEATHIDGGIIDHIYISQGVEIRFDWILEVL